MVGNRCPRELSGFRTPSIYVTSVSQLGGQVMARLLMGVNPGCPILFGRSVQIVPESQELKRRQA
jgi:hypothetical protein